MPQSTFGDVPGVDPGAMFPDRAALHAACVHRQMQAGIAGRGAEGAESIVLNEGYEDDQDLGDEIIYTGEGGRNPSTIQQMADQQLTRGNLALAVSHTQGLPVRVVRGPKLKSTYAPAGGYRYDGLSLLKTTGRTGGKQVSLSAFPVASESGAAWDWDPVTTAVSASGDRRTRAPNVDGSTHRSEYGRHPLRKGPA